MGTSGEVRLWQNLPWNVIAQFLSLWEYKCISFLESWRVKHLDLDYSHIILRRGNQPMVCPGFQNISSIGTFFFLPIYLYSTSWVLKLERTMVCTPNGEVVFAGDLGSFVQVKQCAARRSLTLPFLENFFLSLIQSTR